MMKLIRQISVLAVICLACFAHQVNCQSQVDYIAQLINSLDQSNILRMALERGKRGDGVHHPWMDEMKKLGVRQVSYIFDFRWEGGAVTKLVEKQVKYH